MAALLAQIDLPSLRQDPANLERLLGVFFAAFAVGFLVAVVGHIVQSRTLQIAGILLVFAGTALFMAAVAGRA